MEARPTFAGRHRIGRPHTLAAMLVGFALVSAACGGNAAGPSVASLSSTTSSSGRKSGGGTTNAGGAAPSFPAYTACLTQHGIAASSPSGHGIQITGNVDPGSPQFAAAQKACRKLAPAGGPKPLTAAQQALRMKGLIAFSRCARTHGVPTFPDPNPNPNGFPFGGNAPALLNSPLGRVAFKACDSHFPKVGPQIQLG